MNLCKVSNNPFNKADQDIEIGTYIINDCKFTIIYTHNNDIFFWDSLFEHDSLLYFSKNDWLYIIDNYGYLITLINPRRL